MALHVAALKELGMIVNEGKTEVIVLNRLKDPTILQLDCAGRQIKSKPTMKALGVIIDHKLRW